MYFGVFNILRLIWPYLKESVFGHASFKAWLRQNVITALWFCLMVTMLFVVLYLTSLVRTQYQENVELQHRLELVEGERGGLVYSLSYNRGLVNSLVGELDWTRLFVSQKCPAPAVRPETIATPPSIPTPRLPQVDRYGKLIDSLKQWDQSTPPKP